MPKYADEYRMNLRLGRHERKRLYQITLAAFIEAQDGYCPLCGLKDWWAPTWAGGRGSERNVNFHSPSFDHVVPHKRLAKIAGVAVDGRTRTAFDIETGEHGILGNCLVTHSGCNHRKAAAMPLAHELAILNLVNERLGWDGRCYTNTADNHRYKSLLTALKHRGWGFMLQRHPPDLIMRAAAWSASEHRPRFYPPKREPTSTFDTDEVHPRQTYQRLLLSPPQLGPSLPAPRLWSSQTRTYRQSQRSPQTFDASGLR